MSQTLNMGRYYPPDYDGKSTLNQLHGKHALGDRARKLKDGILIVRFEMPFAIWCGSCDNHIGQGVRFNAEKKRAGSYYTTPIWSFRMKCHLCSAWIEIQTDPKQTDFKVVQGARRKVEEYDRTGEVVQIDEHERDRLLSDPIHRLEQKELDKRGAQEKLSRISELYQLNERYWADPSTQSQRLRRKFREEKKARKEKEAANEAFREKYSLSLPLADESVVDTIAAKEVQFKLDRLAQERKDEALRGALVLTESKFSHRSANKTELASSLRRNTLRRIGPFA